LLTIDFWEWWRMAYWFMQRMFLVLGCG
jgi:hypothetical protein